MRLVTLLDFVLREPHVERRMKFVCRVFEKVPRIIPHIVHPWRLKLVLLARAHERRLAVRTVSW